MGYRWFGGRINGEASIAPFTTDQIYGCEGFDTPEIHDGDTLVRVLVRWRVETDIEDNSSGIQRNAWPVFMNVVFTPDPSTDPIADPVGPGGAALWREALDWQPQPWTDGALFGTKWFADSGQPRSGEAQRIIHDKTTAQLCFGWKYLTGETGIDDTSYIPFVTRGWVQVDFLLLQR